MNYKSVNNSLVLAGCLIVNQRNEVLLLYRKEHAHYETPGGKVKLEECIDFTNPTLDELALAAERELYEELGNDIRVEKLVFFDKVEFDIPDGRHGIANKFLTRIISGEPRVNEPRIFSRFDYLPIGDLEKYQLSPDLKLLIQKLKEKFE